MYYYGGVIECAHTVYAHIITHNMPNSIGKLATTNNLATHVLHTAGVILKNIYN